MTLVLLSVSLDCIGEQGILNGGTGSRLVSDDDSSAGFVLMQGSTLQPAQLYCLQDGPRITGTISKSLQRLFDT